MPPKNTTEEELSKIINWKRFVQYSTSSGMYCYKSPPSSIAEFREWITIKDDRVWKAAGIDSSDSEE